MIIVAAVLAISLGTWWLLKNKAAKDASKSAADSQLPAENAAANYSVPPDIGLSVDNTGGLNFPQGDSGFTFTAGQAQSLPTT
jgi:hypothetical protein